MLALYLFSMILGGGFLLLSVLGGEAEAEFDIDVDTGDVTGGSGDGTDAARILSFRTVVYALFAFGATGVLLDRLGVTGVTGVTASIVTGGVAGLGVGGLFAWLSRTESGDVPGDASLLGLPAKVTLPLSAEVAGTVVVRRGGRRITLRALPHATASTTEPEAWTRVVIVDITEGIARVAPLDDPLLSGDGQES
jgi:hypothetical protein